MLLSYVVNNRNIFRVMRAGSLEWTVPELQVLHNHHLESVAEAWDYIAKKFNKGTLRKKTWNECRSIYYKSP